MVKSIENTLIDITNEFMSGNTTDIVDVLTFIESPWGLNIKLFPVQKFIIKSFYGIDLNNKEKNIKVPDITNDKILYTFNEQEFIEYLYDEGRTNTKEVKDKKFNEMVLVLGRRAGKSSIASYISCYELYKLIKRGDPSKFYNFPPETNISITNVAPTDEQSSVVFDMIQKNVSCSPYLKDRSINQTLTYFNLQTEADRIHLSKKKRASLTIWTGGCSSNSLRGKNNILIIMDEMAFFIDNNGRFSGSEVYRALKPSIGSFYDDGKVICISSPYAKYGKFYEIYQSSFDEPDKMLMFKMYTAMVNPNISPDLLRVERRRDKISFITEYGGEFSDKVTSWIDDEEIFKSCIEVGKSRPEKGEIGIDYHMGIDLGLKNDGTSIAIAHRDLKTNKIIIDYVDVWFSGSSDVWEKENCLYENCRKYSDYEIIPISGIVSEIKELCKWFPIKSGWFDQYNGYALAEQLIDNELKQFRMEAVTDNLNHQIYQLFKSLYGDQKIVLYDDEIVFGELLSLEAERRSRNKIIVRAPNKIGAHDDQSDAIARAIWEIYNHKSQNMAKYSIGLGEKGASRNSSETNMNRFKMNRTKMHGSNNQRKPVSLQKRKIR